MAENVVAARRAAAVKPGALERAVRTDLRTVEHDSPVHNSLAQLAFSLARQLDVGAGMAAAAMGRELRATLDQLTKNGADGDEEFEQRVASLSTEVGDTAQP